MNIVIQDLGGEGDKKRFVASIYAVLNEFLSKEEQAVIIIKPGTKLKNVGNMLRGIADIVDCAKDLVVGPGSDDDDDDEDSADWWKKNK